MKKAETKQVLKMLKKDKKLGIGKLKLIRYLQGKRLTQRESILAHCCDCTGYYADGRKDCEIKSCSLYPFMPYRPRNVKRRKK